METITLQFGGLSEHQHVAEALELPILGNLGAVAACRKAIDLCAASRIGIAVIGPKGAGKSVGLDLGYDWFAKREREMQARENSYAVRRVLRLRAVGSKTDRDVMLMLAGQLNRMYSDRTGGRRKSIPEIRADVLEMCLKKQYALIMVDEAETYAPQALEALRDLLADSQDNGRGRVTETGTRASGIGLLLAGDDTLLEHLSRSREAGHRWRQVVRVPALDAERFAEVYAAWFPGFATEVQQMGEVAWQAYVSSVLCRGFVPSFRGLENHARLYAHYMVRSDPTITGRESIPFNRNVFQLAAEECTWEEVSPARQAAPLSPRRRRKAVRS